MEERLTEVLGFRVSERIAKLVRSYALKFDVSVSKYLRDILAKLVDLSKTYIEEVNYDNLKPPKAPQTFINSPIREQIKTLKWVDEAPRIKATPVLKTTYQSSQIDVINELKAVFKKRNLYIE